MFLERYKPIQYFEALLNQKQLFKENIYIQSYGLPAHQIYFSIILHQTIPTE